MIILKYLDSNVWNMIDIVNIEQGSLVQRQKCLVGGDGYYGTKADMHSWV